MEQTNDLLPPFAPEIGDYAVAAGGPSAEAHPAVTMAEGDRGVRISESLRSTDAGTPADEMDDAADWFAPEDAA